MVNIFRKKKLPVIEELPEPKNIPPTPKIPSPSITSATITTTAGTYCYNSIGTNNAMTTYGGGGSGGAISGSILVMGGTGSTPVWTTNYSTSTATTSYPTTMLSVKSNKPTEDSIEYKTKIGGLELQLWDLTSDQIAIYEALGWKINKI